MAQPKKKTPAAPSKTSGKHRKQKQPTQRPPMQRVLVMSGSGKKTLVWRPWS